MNIHFRETKGRIRNINRPQKLFKVKLYISFFNLYLFLILPPCQRCQQPASVFLTASPQIPPGCSSPETISSPSWTSPSSLSLFSKGKCSIQPLYHPGGLQCTHLTRSTSPFYSCGLMQKEPRVLLLSCIRAPKAPKSSVLTGAASTKQRNWEGLGCPVFTSCLRPLHTFLHGLAYLILTIPLKNQNRSQLAALYFVDLLICVWFSKGGF